jgi:heme iron utilization protein
MRPAVLRGKISRLCLKGIALNELTRARREFARLRDQVSSALLSTVSEDRRPAASHAPLVWLDGHCYLFLSELALHTRNLKSCPVISLMLIENEGEGGNPFARRRITFEGDVTIIPREEPLFDRVLAEYHRRFGKVMALIEPLPDFSLFRVGLREGRYVRGFGQAYDLCGEHLDELVHVRPGG